MTLAFEDANSKLVEIVTVDAQKHVDDTTACADLVLSTTQPSGLCTFGDFYLFNLMFPAGAGTSGERRIWGQGKEIRGGGLCQLKNFLTTSLKKYVTR